MTKDELQAAVASYDVPAGDRSSTAPPNGSPSTSPRFEAHRDRVRTAALSETPSWYSPWGHLLSTTGIGATLLGLGLWRVRGLTVGEAALVPLVFVLVNGVEWHAHKNILHKRRWPLEVIYDRHTPVHHMVFTTEDMALRSSRELRLVLIPAAGVLAIVLSVVPAAALVGALWSSNAGWVLLVTVGLYIVTYELTHLAYHLPETSFIGRLRVIQRLREHHARHHDPRLMNAWNFNVTLPLFDWLLGTIARKDTPRRPPVERGDSEKRGDAAA